MYKRDGRLAHGRRQHRASARRRCAARRSASCSTRSTGRSTKAGSGKATARRSRSGPRARGRSAGDDVPPGAAVSAPETDGAQGASPAAVAEPRWLHALRGWRGALIVYLVFAGTYLGTAGGRLPQPFALQPLRLPGGRLAARPPRAARPAAERERLGEGRGVQAARRPRAARHLRQPHGRPRRPLLPAARHAGDGPAGADRVAVVDPLRLVPAVPGRADGAVRRHLGAGVQRRSVQRAVGRPQPDAAVPAAAPSAARAACRGARRSTICG